jgi:NADPH2:quinone reductase
MKAVVIHQFGGKENLELTEVATPIAGAAEVRVKVAYTAVNPVDWKIREGYLQEMFPHQFPLIPGWDVAGVVDSIGAGVTNLKVGDRVYAYARKEIVQWGTYAEYVVLDANAAAKIPDSLNLAQAATVPLVGLTAWQVLHRFGGVKAGQTIFVQGGSGGVGSFAIQFAKSFGATVIATASAKNREYVLSLGADRVIDYHSEDFVEVIKREYPPGVDFAFDTVGGETLEKTTQIIRSGGALVSIADEPNEDQLAELKIQSAFVFVSPSSADLNQISKLLDSGKVKVPRFEVLPLKEAQKAHELGENAKINGKLLLQVGENEK